MSKLKILNGVACVTAILFLVILAGGYGFVRGWQVANLYFPVAISELEKAQEEHLRQAAYFEQLSSEIKDLGLTNSPTIHWREYHYVPLQELEIDYDEEIDFDEEVGSWGPISR